MIIEDNDNDDLNDSIDWGEGEDSEIDYESKDYFYGNDNIEDDINLVNDESDEIEVLSIEERTTDEIPLAKKHYIDFDNNGGVSTYPIIKAQFYENANFFQCTDNIGRTVLVGTPPNIDLPNKSLELKLKKKL